jgi:hypothetical protein
VTEPIVHYFYKHQVAEGVDVSENNEGEPEYYRALRAEAKKHVRKRRTRILFLGAPFALLIFCTGVYLTTGWTANLLLISAALSVGVMLFVLTIVQIDDGRFGDWLSTLSTPGANEASAASERAIATSADVLTRDFQARMSREIENAVDRLAVTADNIIANKLTERIDAIVGAILSQYWGISSQSKQPRSIGSLHFVLPQTIFSMT